MCRSLACFFFFFQAEDGIRVLTVTGVQTCALPICARRPPSRGRAGRARGRARRAAGVALPAVRIALLTEIPAPFRVPLFNALAARDDVELRVLFLALHDPRRPHYRIHADEHRFDWAVLPGRE